jgi:hypothetical protein
MEKSSGVTFCGLLAIVFITLKLTKFIDWSWWWVLAPFWVPTAFVLAILLVLSMLSVGRS